VDHSRIAANQQRTFLALLAQVLPQVRRDSALPRRIKELLGRNRALGSRDRRLYRELIYTALRFLPWVQPALATDPERAARIVACLAPALPETQNYRAALLAGLPLDLGRDSLPARAAQLRAHFGGDYDPPALLPDWLRAECPAAFESPHLDALNERANLWVRLQTAQPALVLDEFRARRWNYTQPAFPPHAVCLPPNAEVAATDAHRRGFCEIQDLGSQLLLYHAPLAAGQNWLDACAGAGGKTLQLASLLGDSGRVDATDIRPEALRELQDRAARGRFKNIRIGPEPRPGATYDGVLVDAPCSGTGTWRRMPHLKWHTQPEMLEKFARTQLAILQRNAALVRPGGLLVYATCSLARRENQSVVAEFLATRPDFTTERAPADLGARFDHLGYTLLPGTFDSDGFYVALLRRQT
jgi:16S rRNA (cytosine967-C5)-methyltransferase